MKDLRVELLAKSHDRRSFRCESEALTTYFATQARQDVQRKLSACFVMTQGTPQVLGFYTLATDSIPRNDVPASMRKSLPKSYRAPVILLGRLARDLSHRRQGLGELLLMDALLRCLWLSDESVGAMAVVVDPLDEGATAFHARYGFITLPDSGRMFLPMRTIRALGQG